SDLTGSRKAVLIGINYPDSESPLEGCWNDVANMQEYITEHWGFDEDNTMVLTDDQDPDSELFPTRANILAAMEWLVEDAEPNSSLWLHFSGHGVQEDDDGNDEADGQDEAICPVDYEEAGTIIDDEMNRILVQKLPEGARLTVIFDCCHSGSALDLPLIYDATGKRIKQHKKKVEDGVEISHDERNERKKGTASDVIFFSGCQDNQTSADTENKQVGKTGALSYALLKTLQETEGEISYIDLLTAVRDHMKETDETQVPQLSSAHKMDMSTIFRV
ncbi:peptidase C14, partial [Ramicandelaber brevisporus]